MQTCLDEGRFAEARARADLLTIPNGLSVALDESRIPFDRLSDFRTAVADALRTWENSLGRPGFFRSETLSRANIVVRMRPVTKAHAACAAGRATWTRSVTAWGNDHFTNRITASLELSDLDFSGKRYSREALKHIAMHEIGHVLGLADSPTIGRVMGPLVVNRFASQPAAVETLGLLGLQTDAITLANKADFRLALARTSR